MEQQENQVFTIPAATTGRRFINLVVDTILYEIGMFVVVNPLAQLLLGDRLKGNFWAGWLIGMFVLFMYYFVFELAFHRTPGKFITGTKVIMDDGSKPDIGTIAKRTLIRFVPFEAISMYTGKISKDKGTWWHDRWTTTRVVKRTSRPEKQEIESPQLITSASEQKTSSYGLRLLIIFGIVILGCVTITSGGSLLMVVISSLTVGTRWTGNFWEDIFPFILMIAITGIGLFGIFKLVQVLRKKA